MKKIKVVSFFLVASFWFTGCEDQAMQSIDTYSEIAYVKSWFEDNVGSQAQNGRSSSFSGPPLWDFTEIFSKKGIKLYEVPFEGSNRFKIRLDTEHPGRSMQKLVVMQYRGKMEAALAVIIPQGGLQVSENQSMLDLRDFSGIVSFYRWNTDDIMESYYFKDGEILGKSVPEKATVKNSRTTCYEVVSYFYTSVCVANYCAYYQESETTSIYCEFTPSEHNPFDQAVDPGDTFGGGGSGGESAPVESFDMHIIADPSIKNDQKANCIYEKLTGNSVFNAILAQFENSGNLNVTFKLDELPKPSENGKTTVLNNSLGNLQITIDYTNLQKNRTVEAARTFLHEAVHAKIMGYMHATGILNFEQLTNLNFPELWELYVEEKARGSALPQSDAQHELMAAQYVQLIAEGLREFDTRNHNNPEITMDHYVALAWQGLMKKSDGTYTKAYSKKTEGERKKIDFDAKFMLLDCFTCSVINCS